MSKYAVVGNPVSHSLSPQIHARFAQQFNERITYTRILSSANDFPKTLDRFFELDGQGLNITLPFKETAVRWVDHLSDDARLAQAVNTISRNASGYIGHNTDGVGLVRDLRLHHKLDLSGLSTLILGAGGAAKGIIGPLLRAGAKISIANRTVAKAKNLALHLVEYGLTQKGDIPVYALDACEGKYDLVLNATSAEATGQSLDSSEVCVGAFCYDLFYQLDRPTSFCNLAAKQQALCTADGLGMLVEQAAEAYLIWRGKRPKTGPVIESLRKS